MKITIEFNGVEEYLEFKEKTAQEQTLFNFEEEKTQEQTLYHYPTRVKLNF